MEGLEPPAQWRQLLLTESDVPDHPSFHIQPLSVFKDEKQTVLTYRMGTGSINSNKDLTCSPHPNISTHIYKPTYLAADAGRFTEEIYQGHSRICDLRGKISLYCFICSQTLNANYGLSKQGM